MLIPAQLIQKKRDGQPLTAAEIRFFILGFARGEIPDYQMAALAMAICFQGMTTEETVEFTRAMVDSGQVIDWGRASAEVHTGMGASDEGRPGGAGSGLGAPGKTRLCEGLPTPHNHRHRALGPSARSGGRRRTGVLSVALGHGSTSSLRHSGSFLIDKHSTGGIGDKVSLLLAPLVASCGVRVPMISGRGLGPTGGTLDKLESIPGFRADLPLAELVAVTNRVGCVITGATPELAPADGKLYALRDVTATVSCVPLIVASILSKKLAANIDGLVLDVKWGSGAFLRGREESLALAQMLVDVGRRFGKRVCALQTDMNQPLGRTVGNALEVRECLEVLQGGHRPPAADLLEVTRALGAEMLVLAGAAKNVAAAGEMLHNSLARGSALATFRAMVAAQGGDWRQPLPVARHSRPVPAPRAGVVAAIAADQIGYAVIALGGGRRQAGERIDHAVGFEDFRPLGARVRRGEPLAVMHYNDAERAAAAEQLVRAAYRLGDEPAPAAGSRITARVD